MNHLFGVLSDTSGTVQSFGNNYLYGSGSGNATFTSPTIVPMFASFRDPI